MTCGAEGRLVEMDVATVAAFAEADVGEIGGWSLFGGISRFLFGFGGGEFIFRLLFLFDVLFILWRSFAFEGWDGIQGRGVEIDCFSYYCS